MTISEVLTLWDQVPSDEHINLYINIPFCMCQCRYCMYKGKINSTKEERDSFVYNYILPLLEMYRPAYSNRSIDTVYFGGGTPNTISIKEIQDIINTINISKDTKVIFEINPAFASSQYIQEICSIQEISLLTFGVQSFDKSALSVQSRPWVSPLQISEYINICKENKKYSSLDMMCYLKYYNKKDLNIFKTDIDIALNLKSDFITVYPELNLINTEPEYKKELFNTMQQINITNYGYTYEATDTTVQDIMESHRGIFRLINNKYTYKYFLKNILPYYENDFPYATQNIIGIGDYHCNQEIVSYSPKRFFYVEKNHNNIPLYKLKYINQ